MPAQRNARSLLEELIGQQIRTVTGRPNTLLRVTGDDVVVGTNRSPGGEPVPIAQVQYGLERLLEAGEVEVSVPSLGHRSSFVGAVLLTLPGAIAVRTIPPRIRLTDPLDVYRLEEAGSINDWWAGDSHQPFWLEITDRDDIGVDLHCPQRDAAGKRSPGYSLIWWVGIRDVVFHYHLNERAIVAWSRAVGHVTEAPTVWLSHRAITRRRIRTAEPKPGWWLDLNGPFPLDEPLTLLELRERSQEIRAVLELLKSQYTGSLYFPFYFWGDKELRPMQPYLNKLPAEVVDLFPRLTAAGDLARAAEQQPSAIPPSAFGASYREARVSPLPSGRQPFSVDPSIVERGLRGHADTQNELAQALQGAGIEPLSRRPNEPNFDIAWQTNGTIYVAEVKSITSENEEEQLRLGLGQVLRYRHRLQGLGHERVVAVLVPERTPSDPSWTELCRDLGVELLSRTEVERAPMLTDDAGLGTG